MKITSISVTRRDDYEKRGEDKREFKASICVQGDQAWEPKITISLTEAQLEPIVSIISQVVAENMASAAAAFHKEVQAQLAGPVIDQLEDQTPTRVELTGEDDTR